MAYSSESSVRYELGLDDYHPDSSKITEFINRSDAEIDSILGGSAKRFVEKIYYLGDGRFIDIAHPAESVSNLYINNQEYQEWEKDDMLDDGDCEYSSDSTPDYWNSSVGSGDTLTWATDYSYNMYRSLKISKGGSNESYWYSDNVEEVKEEEMYRAQARIKVDSNSSGNVYLRLEFLDVDDSSLVTHDSAAVTIQITQPSSASTLSILSDSSSDTTQHLIIEGIANGQETSEVVSLNGTSSVTSSNSYSYIKGLRLDKATSGTVTVKSNGGAVTNATFSAGDLLKSDWQEIYVEGSAPHDVHSARVILRCTSSSGNCWGDAFRLYKRNWRFLPSDNKIESFINIPDGSLVTVVYERTLVPDLVENLSVSLSALRALVWLTGSDTSADYENLKLGGYAPLGYTTKFKELKEKIDFLINQLKRMDFHNPDLILGSYS